LITKEHRGHAVGSPPDRRDYRGEEAYDRCAYGRGQVRGTGVSGHEHSGTFYDGRQLVKRRPTAQVDSDILGDIGG
jgi:hypothetical protein